ncbi:hypothetical protein [Maribacter arenosus]|uniref:Uncharacterized protein n=1 Tax=Maribacter arenosus TaxID=1854708 RepID=A0ABR7V989_9FLAO|nr:hypothetical protein [Maribacter arenosus]MBD0849420.1 hypothetical protein [Maribacter arenosus]
MELRFKLYAKSFLVYGVISGIALFLWNSFDTENMNFETKVYIIVTAWVITSVSSAFSQIKSVERLKNSKLTTKDFSVFQTEYLNQNIPIDYIFQLLKSNEITKRWALTIHKSMIRGKTNITISSWGEKVKIKSSDNKIIIESKPVLRTAVFDNGKNLKNVKLIKKIIENAQTILKNKKNNL